MTLDLAFLLALLGCVAFAVGWLRAEGKANRLMRERDNLHDTVAMQCSEYAGKVLAWHRKHDPSCGGVQPRAKRRK